MTRRRTATVLSVATVLTVGLAAPADAREGTRYRPAAVGTGAAVATVHPSASRVALEVLAAGGNAVDAAVAAVFTVGVVRPEMCGIGGGGFLVYRSHTGETAALDFREAAPAEHLHGPGVAEAGPFLQNKTGRNRVGVPGTVAGMAAAVERYGTADLGELVAPAAELARTGFPVSRDLSMQMRVHADRLRLYPAAAATFLLGGAVPYPEGATIQFPQYAEALRAVADGGAGAFYSGSIAQKIAADMRDPDVSYDGDAGQLTMHDLVAYEAIWREPLVGSYRGRQVIAMPPPTSGGIVLLEVLNILEGLDLAGFGQTSADHLHYVAEAQKIAWADRNAYIADPAFSDAPVGLLKSKRYAAARLAEIDRYQARDSYAAGGPPRHGSDTPQRPRDGGMHTTHVSVVDADGNAVAVTCSLEEPFGSAVVAPGTGFVLNGQLGDFGAAPNHPEGGKRPRSSMSPTIVVEDGRPALVLGAMGGPTIPLGVAQTLIAAVDFDLDLAHAVDAERLDAQVCTDAGAPPRTLCLEFARVPADVQVDLTRRGHVLGYPQCALHTLNGIPRCDPEYHVLPEVQAVGVTSTGERHAASDPRGECGAAVAHEETVTYQC